MHVFLVKSVDFINIIVALCSNADSSKKALFRVYVYVCVYMYVFIHPSIPDVCACLSQHDFSFSVITDFSFGILIFKVIWFCSRDMGSQCISI